jgi:Fe(3+) dicitrate transport protein
MRGYFLVLTLLLIFPAERASAQNASISGYITEKAGSRSIPGVSVSLEGRTRGTVTDGKGHFVLDHLPAGEHRLLISFMGYHPIRKTIELQGDTRLTLNFELEESLIELEGIIVERVSLTGGGSRLSDIPGSAHYIGPQVLERFKHTDINRILAMVPGVVLQEEDGFGLRPNIGLRGTGVDRSSKITLMEDGILMAPAPYAAPAAYYFPNVGRMQGVEIRKGSSQIKYGPYTTGGAINLLSTPVPREFTTRIHLIGGNFGFRNLYSSIGQSFGRVGILAEAFNTASDGFKNIVGGGNSGFNIEDYSGKLRFESKPDARVYQFLQFKAGYSRERSNETYLGLTRDDFEADPYLRYAGSQVDRMDADFSQFSLRHAIRPASFMDITTTLYHNDFSRNWYKLDKVKASEDGPAVDIASILQDPTAYSGEYDIITGRTSGYDKALSVKANNRSYYARGVETILGFNPASTHAQHNLEIGFRLHQDQMDRFQWVDDYRMTDSTMMLTGRGVPGTDSNQIEEATAFAGFAQYTLGFGRFVFTPGLRYETIDASRLDYGKADTDRTGKQFENAPEHHRYLDPGLRVGLFDQQFRPVIPRHPPGICSSGLCRRHPAGGKHQLRAGTSS